MALSIDHKKFNRSFHFVLISEGGTNDDPVDRGGLTKWGISEKQYPKLDIANLSLETAKHIYYNDYWRKNKCGLMPPDLATVLFDSSVNCGQPSGSKWLQMSSNKLGSTLLVDGIIGDLTMFEVRKYSSNRLLDLIIAERLKRYVWLLDEYPEQKKYIKGWIDRVSNLLTFVSVSDVQLF